MSNEIQNPTIDPDIEDPTGVDWGKCVPWEGEERFLPTGEQTRIPNFRAVDLVRRWEVLDVESEEGFRVVKTSELKPNDIIIGAQINEKAVQAVVKTYGKRFFVAASAVTGRLLDRWEWEQATRDPNQPDLAGQDVLELEALKQIRQKNKIKIVGGT